MSQFERFFENEFLLQINPYVILRADVPQKVEISDNRGKLKIRVFNR